MKKLILKQFIYLISSFFKSYISYIYIWFFPTFYKFWKFTLYFKIKYLIFLYIFYFLLSTLFIIQKSKYEFLILHINSKIRDINPQSHIFFSYIVFTSTIITSLSLFYFFFLHLSFLFIFLIFQVDRYLFPWLSILCQAKLAYERILLLPTCVLGNSR